MAWSPLELFRHHFRLFQLLYRWQAAWEAEGLYLHVHFMRCWCVSRPEAGRCAWFDELTGTFCAAPAASASPSACARHARPEGALEALSLRWYYLDEQAYAEMDEGRAEALLSGVWEALKDPDQRRRDWDELGLPEESGAEALKARFRVLARRHHPDAGGDPELFLRLNRAYRRLAGPGA